MYCETISSNIKPLICKKGKTHNVKKFRAEARRWLCFGFDRCFERYFTSPTILVIVEDGVVIFLHIIEDHVLND
jgi:hypothetical protein